MEIVPSLSLYLPVGRPVSSRAVPRVCEWGYGGSFVLFCLRFIVEPALIRCGNVKVYGLDAGATQKVDTVA